MCTCRLRTRGAGLKSNMLLYRAYFGSTKGLASSRHAPLLRRRRSSALDQTCKSCRAQLGIFFSTSTGHTEEIAGLIKEVRRVLSYFAGTRDHRCLYEQRHPPEDRTSDLLAHSSPLYWSACTLLQEFGDEASDPADIGETDLQKLPEYHGLVVGAPTWNTDCDTERSGTNWDGVLEDIKG